MLKKIAKGFSVIFVLLAAAGCAFGDSAYMNILGYPEAANAKTLYAQLDSGHIRVVDNSTGEVTEEFTFMYRPDGNLMYSYMGSDGDEIYYEFHNGSEINYHSDADTEWSYMDQSDEQYFVYTRTSQHPYTAEGMISVNAYAITDSKAEPEGDGWRITFYYNAHQLADPLAEVGKLDSFESTLWINGDGYCYRLDQLAVFDGGETVSDFSMYIDSMNEVKELVRPEIDG